ALRRLPRPGGEGPQGGRGAAAPRGGGGRAAADRGGGGAQGGRRGERRDGGGARGGGRGRARAGGERGVSADIPAADVKALRDRTGAGMMDSKQALVEANGDVDKAVEILRVKGQAQAAKRGGRTATEGVV